MWIQKSAMAVTTKIVGFAEEHYIHYTHSELGFFSCTFEICLNYFVAKQPFIYGSCLVCVLSSSPYVFSPRIMFICNFLARYTFCCEMLCSPWISTLYPEMGSSLHGWLTELTVLFFSFSFAPLWTWQKKPLECLMIQMGKERVRDKCRLVQHFKY